jgi:hypothetical protein
VTNDETSQDAQAPSIEPINKGLAGGEADLSRYGITSHEHTSYEWNGYRYSNAADAIAAAKRAVR